MAHVTLNSNVVNMGQDSRDSSNQVSYQQRLSSIDSCNFSHKLHIPPAVFVSQIKSSLHQYFTFFVLNVWIMGLVVWVSSIQFYLDLF